MGEDRAIEAAQQAVSSPLLETSITGATDAIINITGGVNLTLFEAEQAAEVVRNAANTDINTIFGSVINENLTDEVIVTVIATGFDKGKKKTEVEPLYSNVQTTTRRVPSRTVEVIDTKAKEEEVPAPKPQTRSRNDILEDDDDDGDFDIPVFLRNKNY